MIKFLKKPWVIVLIVIIAGGILGYVFWSGEKEPNYDFIIVEKGEVVQEVSVTGTVRPVEDVDLAFEKTGKITAVLVSVGDEVYVGQTLVRLDNSDELADLAAAEATLKAQEAKLNELKIGTRPEEIQVQEIKVENAKTSLNEVKKNLVDKLQDSYTKSDDAIRNHIDQFFSNPRTSPQVNFSINDTQLETNIEQRRFLIESVLIFWRTSLDELVISSDLALYTEEAKQNLAQVKSLLNSAALAINALTADSGLSQATIDGWKTDVSTARTNINTATVNLSTAEEELKTAESNLLLEENQLTLLEAGTIVEQIIAQEAQVEKAEADVQSYKAELSKTVMISPISGVVTKQDVEVGEISVANANVISIISADKFEVKTSVPEADIANIKIGDTAVITLDAYGEGVFFLASVTMIDPAEIVIEGVPTYKVTLQFDEEDGRIRSGMTANTEILTNKLENVITVPQRAVIARNGNKIVRKLEFSEELQEDEIVETPVIVGLRGSDGNIEIVEGIKEGDRVITFMREE